MDTTPSSTGLSTPNIEEYRDLTAMKRSLQARLREIEGKLKPLESRVLDDMLSAGVSSIKVEGATVYVAEQCRVRLADDVAREEAANTLRNCDRATFLLREDFNLNTLSAWCREVLDSGEELPTEFKQAFVVERGPALRLRKSS